MKKILQSSLTITLVPLTILTAVIGITQHGVALSAERVSVTKQVKFNTAQVTNSYRVNYERAIGKGIISRPSGVENEDQALELAYEAISLGDRYEAAVRFAQALVIISERDGVTAALARERRFDANLRQRTGEGLRQYLPLLERIFPSSTSSTSSTSKPSTPYRANYERAITRNVIKRPSPVENDTQAIELAYQAMERGNRNEAAIRFAQALVIISEKQGATKALAFERRLEAEMLEQQNQTLRGYLPLFERIFPLTK